MADAFSSSSENVIQRLVDVQQKTITSLEELDDFYDIQKTCNFISLHQFGKVGDIFCVLSVSPLRS